MRLLRLLNLGLALAVLAAGMAAWGGIADARLDVLTHFALAFLFLALASLAFAWRTATPGRVNIQMAIALVAVLAWLSMVAPELTARVAPRTAPAGEPRLRVMEFNVYRHNADLARAESVIRESGADIVLTIETIGDSRYLPRSIRDLYPHRVRCECDMSILSRWPIIDDSVRRDTRPGRQREPSLVWAIVRTPHGDVPIVGTHYQWPTKPKNQLSMQKVIAEELKQFDRGSAILMGDLNSAPWSFFMRRQDQVFGLERRTRGLPTWPAQLTPWPKYPAPFPLLPIDHVYAGSDWRTLSVRRTGRAGSDHYPVVVTLSRRSDR